MFNLSQKLNEIVCECAFAKCFCTYILRLNVKCYIRTNIKTFILYIIKLVTVYTTLYKIYIIYYTKRRTSNKYS